MSSSDGWNENLSLPALSSAIAMSSKQLTMQEKRKMQEEHDKWMKHAVAIYRSEQEKSSGAKPKGLRTICHELMDECKKTTGIEISLNHGTLRNLVNGGRTIRDFNAGKAWLSDIETKHVISYALDTASRAFPFSHRRLREHVEEILRAQLGEAFRVDGLGHNWTSRFVANHAEELKTCWSRSLEHVRGGAVNPTTNHAWFTMLGDVLDKEAIEVDCIWAADETGFLPSLGTKERVIGPTGIKTQYQQRDGSRETITVMVTICADGSSIAPTVIFKGHTFTTKWNQENPLNAS
jgi:hypothetical protein